MAAIATVIQHCMRRPMLHNKIKLKIKEVKGAWNS